MSNNRIKKVVIFCGGEGTRLSELTGETPKPLIPINGVPVVVHIMRHFYAQGYREFILAVGYKSEQFKSYFRDYSLQKRNVTFTKYGFQSEDSDEAEDWIVRVIETGEKSTTGQRLNSIKPYIKEGEPFFLTYGDSVSDVDLLEVEKAHFSTDHVATITAVQRDERFGILSVDGKNTINSFNEKSASKTELINGGFIACNYEIFDSVDENSGDFSFEALTTLAKQGHLGYYFHEGFWHAMDTKKDLDKLNKIYAESTDLK